VTKFENDKDNQKSDKPRYADIEGTHGWCVPLSRDKNDVHYHYIFKDWN